MSNRSVLLYRLFGLSRRLLQQQAEAVKFMKLSDFAALLRWPYDHCVAGKYGAQNDNDWVREGNHRTHRLDLQLLQKGNSK